MTAVVLTDFGDLLTDLAEKIGETTQNSNDNRKRMINNAYRYIANENLWWWLETEDTSTTTTTALSYTLPANFRAFRRNNPVKVSDSWYILIDQADQQLWDGTSSIVNLPSLSGKKRAYIWGTKIYFVQSSMTSGQTISYYFYRQIIDSNLLDADSDEPLVPIGFREMISLLAAGNYLKSQGGRESVEGNDYLELYDQYLEKMKLEQSNRRSYGILRRTLDPEEAAIYRM